MKGALEKKDFVWQKMIGLGQPGFDPIGTTTRVSKFIAAKWIRVRHWEGLPKGVGTNIHKLPPLMVFQNKRDYLGSLSKLYSLLKLWASTQWSLRVWDVRVRKT